MNHPDIYSATLGLIHPWHITSVLLAADGTRLDITIDFHGDGGGACVSCGRATENRGTIKETWRHDNFFHHETFLHAKVPRLCCPDCGESRVERPWSRPGSRFLLTETCDFNL